MTIRFTPISSEIRSGLNQKKETVYYMAIVGTSPDLAGPKIIAVMPFPDEASAIKSRAELGMIDGQDWSVLGINLDGTIIDSKTDSNQTMIRAMRLSPLTDYDLVAYRRDLRFAEMLKRYEAFYANNNHAAAREELHNYAASVGMIKHISSPVNIAPEIAEQGRSTNEVVTSENTEKSETKPETEVTQETTNAEANVAQPVNEAEPEVQATESSSPSTDQTVATENSSAATPTDNKADKLETVDQAPPPPVSAPAAKNQFTAAKAPVRSIGKPTAAAATPATPVPATKNGEPAAPAATEKAATPAAEKPAAAAPVLRMGRRAGFGMVARAAGIASPHNTQPAGTEEDANKDPSPN